VPRWAMTPSAQTDERRGTTSTARNQLLARSDPLFGYYFAPVWGTIVLMARPRKPQFSGGRIFSESSNPSPLQRGVCELSVPPAGRVSGSRSDDRGWPAMTTASGAVRACRPAARLGVSPTTDCSCTEPSPIRSPTTIRPGGRCRRGLRAFSVYYARHVEKNSSLRNWIDGFLATAAREWLATRKGRRVDAALGVIGGQRCSASRRR
jgi:hypothetical protein